MTEQSRKHLPDQTLDSPQKPLKIARTEEEDQQSEQNMSQNPRLQRYLVAIEYIGTRFSGSQQQPNCRTAVGVLEEAFRKFIGQSVSVFCSSRTDAGVHALSNVCHVDVERISKRKPGEVLPPHEPAVVKRAVNHFLQKNEGDIMVIDVRSVPSNFHARYNARERTYFYRMLSGPEPLSTFEKDRAWHVPEELDVLAMQEACKILVGYHDFSSFRAAGCQANSPIRTLDEIRVNEVATSFFSAPMEMEHNNIICEEIDTCLRRPGTDLTSPNGDRIKNSKVGLNQEFSIRKRHRCYVVTARARSFLYHQVRLLVGVLKCVGTGELTASDDAFIMKH
ncbi:Pseudouridine synthase I, TruA, alpha/beta domain [Dillenia turbinata]|uniref:tRNA pseudouridine synthase n=1 Tax=Dillenia turbinata TaxID=194707 RepID=A0AAN8ZU95_9MAGN